MLRLDSSTGECRGYMLLSAAEDATAKDGDELFATFFSAVATLPVEETWSSLQQVLTANAAKAVSSTPVRIVSGADGDEPLTPQCAQNVAAAAVRAVRVSLPAGIGSLLVSRETCGTSCSGTSCAHPEDVPASVVDAEKTAFKKLFAQLEDTWIFKLLRGDDGAVAVEPSGGGGSSGDSSSGCGDCVCEGDSAAGTGAGSIDGGAGGGSSAAGCDAPPAAGAGADIDAEAGALRRCHADTLAILSLPPAIWTAAMEPEASNIITDCSEGCCKPGPPVEIIYWVSPRICSRTVGGGGGGVWGHTR